MPDGAMDCNIPSLPPGLKVEAAMFVELQDPTSMGKPDSGCTEKIELRTEW